MSRKHAFGTLSPKTSVVCYRDDTTEERSNNIGDEGGDGENDITEEEEEHGENDDVDGDGGDGDGGDNDDLEGYISVFFWGNHSERSARNELITSQSVGK